METFTEFLTLDFILLILLLGFIGWGFAHGFISAVGGIIGIFVSAFVASHYYLWLADIIGGVFGPFEGLARLVSFALIFLLVGRLFGLLVRLVQSAFDILAFLPFLKSINRIAGLLFGFVFGVLVLGTALFILSKHSPWESFNNAAAESEVAQYLIVTSKVVKPLFPSAVQEIKSVF